jgi:hypothetical protein
LYSFVNDLLALAMDSILHHIGGVHEIGGRLIASRAADLGRSAQKLKVLGVPGNAALTGHVLL